MSERMVLCSKFKEELQGLEEPPFEGELGQLIYDSVSAKAWAAWKDDLMIKVINEYRLNLADTEHYDVLLEQMKAFLELSDGQALEVENAERGKQG